jgi:hypothetical protein
MARFEKCLLVIFVFAAVSAASCTTKKAARNRESIAATITQSFLEEKPAANYKILDYQGKNRGQPLPDWVELYLNGGVSAIEKAAAERPRGAPVPQNEFTGKYLFVSVQKSGNLAALLQWKNNFPSEGDFSAMIFPRIYRRIVRGLNVNPERHYGSFFGEFMRLAANAAWPNLTLAGSVWITLSVPPEPQSEAGGQAVETTVGSASGSLAGFSGETNLVVILLTADKLAFERELLRIFNRIPRDKTQSGDQRSAASRLESNFFEWF